MPQCSGANPDRQGVLSPRTAQAKDAPETLCLFVPARLMSRCILTVFAYASRSLASKQHPKNILTPAATYALILINFGSLSVNAQMRLLRRSNAIAASPPQT